MNSEFPGYAFIAPNSVLRVSAWLPHGPFTQTLVRTMRAQGISELGTHYAFSCFVSDEPVASAGHQWAFYTLDRSERPEHASLYEGDVYPRVVAKDGRHGPSALLQKTFADGLTDADQVSIDLFHFDGRNCCRDVKDLLESWRPTASRRTVALFYDTKARRHAFDESRSWVDTRNIVPSILELKRSAGAGFPIFGRPVGESDGRVH